MYRDLIEAPEHIEINGRDWWVQIMNHWDGTLACVNVYDQDGYFIEEFKSEEEAMQYIQERS